MRIEKVTFDAEAHHCAAHLKSSARVPVGPYTIEYAFFVTLKESGEETIKIGEMADSAVTKEVSGRLQAYLQKAYTAQ